MIGDRLISVSHRERGNRIIKGLALASVSCESPQGRHGARAFVAELVSEPLKHRILCLLDLQKKRFVVAGPRCPFPRGWGRSFGHSQMGAGLI